MVAPTNYDQTNAWLADVGQRAQELINLLKAGIDVGQTGTLGNLALFEDLATAPIGNLAALQTALQVANVAGRGVAGGTGDLMAKGAYGIGAETAPDLIDVNTTDAESGLYRVVVGTLNRSSLPGDGGIGYMIINRLSGSPLINQIWTENSTGRVFSRTYLSGGWQNWIIGYDRNNIIGTVSQSGGVPTGAVIEEDSNSFWSWVKLASGDMTAHARIVHDNVDINVARGSIFESTNFTPPDIPSGFISGQLTVATDYYALDDVSVFGSSAGGSNAFQQYRFIRATATTGRSVVANIMLKGRWY